MIACLWWYLPPSTKLSGSAHGLWELVIEFKKCLLDCLFGLVCGFTSQSAAIMLLRWSVNLTTLFLVKLRLNGLQVLSAHTSTCTDNSPC